jgi:hypothetical protein
LESSELKERLRALEKMAAGKMRSVVGGEKIEIRNAKIET